MSVFLLTIITAKEDMSDDKNCFLSVTTCNLRERPFEFYCREGGGVAAGEVTGRFSGEKIKSRAKFHR